MSSGPLVTWGPHSTAKALLVCLPHAGAGAYQFRPWQEYLGPHIAVVAVQLAGRENRWRHEPATRLHEVLDELTPALAARVDLPYFVFGHSMGALVGYELARALGLRYGRWPSGFVASASRAPNAQGEPSYTDDLTDEQLADELVTDGALPASVSVNQRLAAVLVRPLRADLAICDSYQPPVEDARLPCPLAAWRGHDDTGVTQEHADDWRQWTTGPYATQTFPGGHFYHLAAPHTVTQALKEFVAIWLSERD